MVAFSYTTWSLLTYLPQRKSLWNLDAAEIPYSLLGRIYARDKGVVEKCEGLHLSLDMIKGLKNILRNVSPTN